MSASPAASDTEPLLRALAPRVLGALVRQAGDFSAAEDALQEALLAAHQQWPRTGLPANPGGWLFRVAQRRLADERASEEARRARESAAVEPLELASAPPFEEAGDDTLELFFLCCHPALPPPAAIALTLRAVGGLSTAEIASAFLVPETTMAQRILRAKRGILAAGASFGTVGERERAERLTNVLHVLYLVFNEGYARSAGTELVRVELAHEALRLTRALRRLVPEHAETAGLLALMLLTDARRPARTGPQGELVPLDEQDRRLWDRVAIAEGSTLISAVFARGELGPYQLQAAIAALHDEAESTASTDWAEIQALYSVLARLSDNPLVALNQAVASAMVSGPAAGLESLRALESDERLVHHHRLAAVRAHFQEQLGRREDARRSYLEAASRTASVPERDYLLKRAARLADG